MHNSEIGSHILWDWDGWKEVLGEKEMDWKEKELENESTGQINWRKGGGGMVRIQKQRQGREFGRDRRGDRGGIETTMRGEVIEKWEIWHSEALVESLREIRERENYQIEIG